VRQRQEGDVDVVVADLADGVGRDDQLEPIL
jgi:hypothetical protein